MDSEKTVGTILREARLAKRLSLADAEKGTSIRSRYLEALERDEYDKTPGEVFMKGMIRNYGNFLGLNGPELVQLYKASAAGVAKEAVKSAGIPAPPTPASMLSRWTAGSSSTSSARSTASAAT